MANIPALEFDPACIPDGWPTPALAATIEESRSAFAGRRVLITGATGFVGGHLVRAMHAAGAIVTALDKNCNPVRGCHLDLTGMRHKVTMCEADITDRERMAELVRENEFHYIFHLAAGATVIEKALADPYGTIMANTMGFVNLAEGARLLPEEKRPIVIYSSTDKVYGEAEVLPYTEEHDLGGVGVYDAAKLCADILAGTYDKALGVRTIVLRMCNIFGPYDLNFDYRLIPKAMRNIFRDGESPELYMTSLEHFRDYCYVEDAVRAYFHIARSPECHGRVYNLPGIRYSSTPDVLRDIVSYIGDYQDSLVEQGSEAPLAQHKWNRSIRVVPSDPSLITISKQHLDGTRIRNEACFEPQVGFREGLHNTALFYLWYFTNVAPNRALQEMTNIEHDDDDFPDGRMNGTEEMETNFETTLEDGLPVQVMRIRPRIRRKRPKSASRPAAFLLPCILPT
jgi:nucleoside-diphosphate-sugar epimerase